MIEDIKETKIINITNTSIHSAAVVTNDRFNEAKKEIDTLNTSSAENRKNIQEVDIKLSETRKVIDSMNNKFIESRIVLLGIIVRECIFHLIALHVLELLIVVIIGLGLSMFITNMIIVVLLSILTFIGLSLIMLPSTRSIIGVMRSCRTEKANLQKELQDRLHKIK